MSAPNATYFPDNIAALVGNLATPGSATASIFEFREAMVRSLAAFNLITLYRQPAAPAVPAAWDFWIVPGTLSGATVTGTDLKIWDGAVWQNPTPALFGLAIVNKSGFSATVTNAQGSAL